MSTSRRGRRKKNLLSSKPHGPTWHGSQNQVGSQILIALMQSCSQAKYEHLTCLSFGADCNSPKGFVSPSREFKNDQESSNGQASSSSASIPVVFEDSVGGQSGPVDSQSRTSNNSISDEAELPLPINDESISPRDIESYPDIGLIQSHADSYKSHEPQERQGPPSLVDFLAYDPQMRFDMPFSKTTMEDNAQGQGLSSIYI